jgi:hypothetical protein
MFAPDSGAQWFSYAADLDRNQLTQVVRFNAAEMHMPEELFTGLGVRGCRAVEVSGTTRYLEVKSVVPMNGEVRAQVVAWAKRLRESELAGGNPACQQLLMDKGLRDQVPLDLLMENKRSRHLPESARCVAGTRRWLRYVFEPHLKKQDERAAAQIPIY